MWLCSVLLEEECYTPLFCSVDWEVLKEHFEEWKDNNDFSDCMFDEEGDYIYVIEEILEV